MGTKTWNGPDSGDPKPIIYAGAVLSSDGEKAAHTFPGVLRFCCLTYYSLRSLSPEKVKAAFSFLTQQRIRCFLDSGAYSYQMQALQKGQSLDRQTASQILDGYIKWCQTSTFPFDFLVTFDYLRNVEITEWATKRMEQEGLHPMPVYHLGSPLSALRRWLDKGYSLIGVGGLIPYQALVARPFLDQVFALTEKYHVHCHGFGIGGKALLQYPWFSVDSTYWLWRARTGNVLRASLDPRRLAERVSVSPRTVTHGGGLH
jgi:hypothetical protein